MSFDARFLNVTVAVGVEEDFNRRILRHACDRFGDVGFDDVPVARYLRPALTTVRAPIEQVGREGVRQLVRLIRGQQAEALVLMRTELVIRESCGCGPGLAT